MNGGVKGVNVVGNNKLYSSPTYALSTHPSVTHPKLYAVPRLVEHLAKTFAKLIGREL